MKRTVITNVSIKLPIQSTIMYSFLLYYFNVGGLAWGIFITLYVIYWVLAIIAKINEVRINLDEEISVTTPVSNFQKRLEAIIKIKK